MQNIVDRIIGRVSGNTLKCCQCKNEVTEGWGRFIWIGDYDHKDFICNDCYFEAQEYWDEIE